MEAKQSVMNWVPVKGDIVGFAVYTPSCIPGNAPLANYKGHGVYLGECADGHIVRATECSEPSNIGQVIFTSRVSRVLDTPAESVVGAA